MEEYKFEQSKGAFMGGHFEYETELQYSLNIARNVVAAILHMAHTKKKVTYRTGMTKLEFYAANERFINEFAAAFKKKRNYDLSNGCMALGIVDFMDRMEEIKKDG